MSEGGWGEKFRAEGVTEHILSEQRRFSRAVRQTCQICDSNWCITQRRQKRGGVGVGGARMGGVSARGWNFWESAPVNTQGCAVPVPPLVVCRCFVRMDLRRRSQNFPIIAVTVPRKRFLLDVAVFVLEHVLKIKLC